MTPPPRRAHTAAGNHPGKTCHTCQRPAVGVIYRHPAAMTWWQRLLNAGPVYYCPRHVTHAIEKAKGHTR